jgi:hypothetical protein
MPPYYWSYLRKICSTAMLVGDADIGIRGIIHSELGLTVLPDQAGTLSLI